MWVKVDDTFPEHPKVAEAGRHLGSYGVGRVIAVWTHGMCYCNRNLTDGLVTEQVWRSWTLIDRRPLDVAEVMVMAGLLDRSAGGYRFHDYEHYQPLAQTVKEKRAHDRARKRGKRPRPQPRALRPARMRTVTANPRLLVKLAHLALDEQPGLSPVDVGESVKWRAAALGVQYDGGSVGAAVDQAFVQRRKARTA